MKLEETDLTTAQKQALLHVDSWSIGEPIDPNLKITIHFHPDRASSMGHILESLADKGTYKSQFETNTSNGGLTAHPGGDRWKWESRIFGTAYDNVGAGQRPKYGSLNYKGDAYGGSPRFGSAYIRLGSIVATRSTFCYPDSVFEPEAYGTAKHIDLVRLAEADDKDLLDDYIETQVHGDIKVTKDVEAIVLDPCYKGTAVEKLAIKLQCPIEWHEGYSLSIIELNNHPDYRGPEYIKLGKKIAKSGFLNPKVLGDCAATGQYDEQDLKRVWHLLARFGRK